MCAINPKRQAHFKLSVYTAHEMTDEAWEDLTTSALIEAELKLNESGRLRWHVSPVSEAKKPTSGESASCPVQEPNSTDKREAHAYKAFENGTPLCQFCGRPEVAHETAAKPLDSSRTEKPTCQEILTRHYGTEVSEEDVIHILVDLRRRIKRHDLTIGEKAQLVPELQQRGML